MANDYPEPYRSAAKDALIDPCRLYSRECVSWCAWKTGWDKRINKTAGKNDARNWLVNATAWGVETGKTPAVGATAVFVYGTYGHVGHVEQVDYGRFLMSEYNYDLNGNYNERWVSSSVPDGFIYWKGKETTTPATPTTSVGQGKDDQASSNVIQKVVAPVGITLAMLASSLGVSVNDIKQADNTGTLNDKDSNQVLTDDEAKAASEAATEAVIEAKGSTPLDLAKGRAGLGYEIVKVETWDGLATTDGTIWTICENHSNKLVGECVAETITNNQETITLTASEHNINDYSGHWVFDGEELVIVVN